MDDAAQKNQLVGLYDHFLGGDLAYLEGLKADAKRALHGLETGLVLKSKDANGAMTDFPLVIPKYAITLVCARTGGGKCLGAGTPVMLADGSVVPVEKIKVGDFLMGDDSAPRKVLSLARGLDELYKITPVKGDAWVCNSSHVLSLIWNTDDTTTRERNAIYDIPLNKYQCLSKKQKHTLKQFRVGVDFERQEVPLAPYMLGVWLGDGTSAQTSISNIEDEIIEYIQVFAKEYGLNTRWTFGGGTGRSETIHLTSGAGRNRGKNKFRNALNLLGVVNNKHIPDAYLKNDCDTRLQLLAGLIDTDGHMHHGHYEIAQKNKRLADNIVYLARSLGFAAYKRKKFVNGAEYQRITISGDLECVPCLLPRKRVPKRMQIKSVLRTGFTVSHVGFGQYFGFELDGNGRFLLGDFTVTHNTTCMTDVTVRLCMKGKKGFFITLEEPAFAINAKMLASYSRKLNPNHSMQAVTVAQAFKALAGKEQVEDMAGFRRDILKHCRVIDANSTVDLGKVSSPTVMYDPQYVADLIRYRNDKAGEPLDFVVIDFGQLMETNGGENSQVYMRLKAVMQAAKNMAGSLGIAVIMGAQLRREVINLDIWDWEPEHIRDGSDIEQAASLILATGVDKKHTDPAYQTTIRFLKNRYGPKRVAGMFKVEYQHCHFPDHGMEPFDD